MVRLKRLKRLWSVLFVVAMTVFLLVLLLLVFYSRDMRKARRFVHGGSKLIHSSAGAIEYMVYGSGEPLLVCHGAGGGFDQALLISKILGKGFRFILPSRFGYLRSKSKQPVTAELQAEAYYRLIKKLGVAKTAIAAFSAGGPAALSFAARYPEHCEKLVLISCINASILDTKDNPWHQRILKLLCRSDFLYWCVTKLFRQEVLGLFGISRTTQVRLAGSEQKWLNDFFYTTMPVSLRASGSLNDLQMNLPSRPLLASIRAPTLILHVKTDPLVSFRHAQMIHQTIKNSRLIIFDDGGHFSIGHHQEMTAAVREFLLAASSPKELDK